MSAGTGRLVLLGAVVALGSLAIQIIVPALPMLAAGIGASATGGQLVISVYLVGLALGQLAWAPIADHHGRRPVLLWGIVIFIAGTLCCAMASDLAVMLLGRAIQSVGASSSLVSGRAMATDTAPAGKAAAPLATLSSITLISPAVAPAIGGAVAGFSGWRSLFWILAVLALAGLMLALRMAPETRPGDRLPAHPRRLASTYWSVATHRSFLPRALATAMIGGGFYLFLAASPFVLKAAGATSGFAGLFYSGVACGIMAGTLCVPLISRRRPDLLLPIADAFLAVGAAMIVGVALAGIPLGAMFAAMCVIAFGAGITTPSLLGQAIEWQRERASAATSLFGTFQMGGAALFSTLAVRLLPSPETELIAIGGLVIGALAVRRLGGGAPSTA